MGTILKQYSNNSAEIVQKIVLDNMDWLQYNATIVQQQYKNKYKNKYEVHTRVAHQRPRQP